MKKAGLFLLRSWVWLIGLQPLPVLYFYSFFLRFLLYRVIKYRRKVVWDNLKNAFPEKSDTQRTQVMKDFYGHFSELLVEIVKQGSISSKNLVKRMKFLNPEVIPEMTAHGGGGIAIFGHYGNWEWLGSGMGLQLPFSTVGVYKPLKSDLFDQLVYHIRTRHGNEMIPQASTLRESIRRLKSPCYIAFLSDQTPLSNGRRHFTHFLNQATAVHLGISHIALKLKCPIYYFDVRKVKRGYYTVELRKIPIEPYLPFSEENVERLTDAHVEMLEEVIQKEPAYWLWSHRRWKRKVRERDSVSEKLRAKLSTQSPA